MEHPNLADAISDLLKSNGTSPTPDRHGFQSGRYGIAMTPYQKYLRKGISETSIIPNSHSFAKHTQEKQNALKGYCKIKIS